MKVFDDNGKELDAIFSVSHAGKDRIHLTLESRGGGEGGPRPPRNADYAEGIELLLSRLGKMNAVLENVEVFSSVTKNWPSENRRISATSITLPKNIRDIPNLREFRIELGRAGSALGRTKAPLGGSYTKKLRFLLKLDASHSKSENELELIFAKNNSSIGVEVEPSVSKYAKLGAYLKSSSKSEIRLRLSEIEEIIESTLPTDAHTPQFWANTAKHHLARRDQWLRAGYDAFYEKRTETVRFIKSNVDRGRGIDTALEPTDNPDELQRRVALAKNKMLKPDGGLIDPPEGTDEVKTAQANVTRHVRDPKIVAWVLAQAAGACEACHSQAPFVDEDGEPFLEVHHVRPLAKGGPDKTDNAVALCPNCHRFFHFGEGLNYARSDLISNVRRLIDYPERKLALDES